MSRRAVRDADLGFLRGSTRPPTPSDDRFTAVDLFAGCGGMSVGLCEAARRLGYGLNVPLAVEMIEEFASVYEANVEAERVEVGLVEESFPGKVGNVLSLEEARIRDSVGDVDILVGGPPCQGHSDLNNHTRRSDPRNQLYLRMARAAEVLQPSVVVVENVTAVQWDVDEVVLETQKALEKLDYNVAGEVVDMHSLGVPQKRRRHLLIGSRIDRVDPSLVFNGLKIDGHEKRDLRWAIGDLEECPPALEIDRPSLMSATNRERVAYLFEHDEYDLPNRLRPDCHRDGNHSYKSVYGRLRWDQPAQTITTGFGSMGQGRYVHPGQPRTITPHEAARLQTFPDWFDFGANTKRTRLATMIGNAVPPLMMVRLGEVLFSELVRP